MCMGGCVWYRLGTSVFNIKQSFHLYVLDFN